MTLYEYDGTFEGLLCAIFATYARHEQPEDILRAGAAQPALWADRHLVATDADIAARVAAGVARRGGAGLPDRLYRAFLSEQPGVERLLLHAVQAVVAHGAAARVPLGPLEAVERLARRVSREVHRVHGFVRFAEEPDGLLAAAIAPECDVLPLAWPHFAARFAAQRWLITDARRGYGVYYDGREARLLADLPGAPPATAPDEPLFQQLWRTYFGAVNIPERSNPRLHLHHLPRRYWKYLTEKQAPQKQTVPGAATPGTVSEAAVP